MTKSSNLIKRLKNSIIIISIVFGGAIVALSVLLSLAISRSNSYKLQLENNYKRNFYELISDINSLEIDLSKLIATNSLSSQKELLTSIYDTTKTSAVNLSTLPIANNKIENLNNYLNTVGGYSYSLLEKNLNSQEKISKDELSSIEKIYDYCVKIKYDLNNAMGDVEDFNVIQQINFSNGDLSSFDGGLSGINDNKDEVPTLIYDGPFSDSVINKNIKGLGKEKYSEEEAREILSNNFKFFENATIEYVGETLGKFATYNYNITNESGTLYVQITKQGAFVLSINSINMNTGDKNLTIEESELFAHNFAALMGIDDMYSVWSQQVNNIAYINLAPIIDNVIYYPDLIKVKINTSTGFVVGWEASNYAYNHTERDEFEAELSVLEAKEMVSDALDIKEINLCVIPNKFVGESLAYEFICTWKNFTYYVYLDVNNGEELNIMRVVNTTNGDLLM